MTLFTAIKLYERYQHLLLHARNLGIGIEPEIDITEDNLDFMLSVINKEAL
jgi:hypothetical protein